MNTMSLEKMFQWLFFNLVYLSVLFIINCSLGDYTGFLSFIYLLLFVYEGNIYIFGINKLMCCMENYGTVCVINKITDQSKILKWYIWC